MIRFSRDELDAAAARVHQLVPPTPQRNWPLLSQRLGVETWVKHENHAPTGAFKVRGGITFVDWLKRTQPEIPGLCTATRGNHGQSQAMAATAAGLRALIYVPEGNSVEKNAAMAAFGAELVVHGSDFDTAREEAVRVAAAEGLAIVPPFHAELVRGVATYAWELFHAVPDLDTVYVPIGCGSGICGTILARDALGLATKIVGVVSSEAACAKLSVEAGRPVETPSARTFADGMAVRVPVAEALEIYQQGADRIVAVSDAEVAEAMRLLFACTHNVAEGAGAAALAALRQEGAAMAGRRVGVILSGGNVDTEVFREVLSDRVPLV
ncbi:threonine dehydratase [Tropicimonas sp. IMCC6043]|uniref:threonine dehydratase n=1 Tax=Tropicimonas sp. IMCC6043 TaxID=2510645 RepID=UPI00101DBBD7|nr:threonine dehydratase [Tropicimonas sp. IMCC6043]RYH12131.1 threonine dehydratase [Tropicimonas sp. IMCC6043]